jgi:hypothetical protein
MKPTNRRKLSLRTQTLRPLDAGALAGAAGSMTPLSFTVGCYTANCMTLGTYCDTHDCMLTFTSCSC